MLVILVRAIVKELKIGTDCAAKYHFPGLRAPACNESSCPGTQLKGLKNTWKECKKIQKWQQLSLPGNPKRNRGTNRHTSNWCRSTDATNPIRLCEWHASASVSTLGTGAVHSRSLENEYPGTGYPGIG
eukprot:3461778-Rhodomonas_salina.1